MTSLHELKPIQLSACSQREKNHQLRKKLETLFSFPFFIQPRIIRFLWVQKLFEASILNFFSSSGWQSLGRWSDWSAFQYRHLIFQTKKKLFCWNEKEMEKRKSVNETKAVVKVRQHSTIVSRLAFRSSCPRFKSLHTPPKKKKFTKKILSMLINSAS